MKRIFTATFAICLLSGCRSGLETDYQPQRLGVTAEERRGYYAPAFSREAAAAAAARESGTSNPPPVPRR